MKKHFLPHPPLSSQKVAFVLLLFFITSLAAAQNKYIPKYLTEKDNPLAKDAKTLTPNGWIELKEETSVTPDEFFKRYGNSLGLSSNPHLTFEKFRSDVSQKGEEHLRYQLYYEGIKVEGLEFLLHTREGKVRSASGKIISSLEINIKKRLEEVEAFELTRKALGIVNTSDDKERLAGELLIARVDIEDFSPKSFVLVYKFLMNVPKEASAFYVYVDAKTGEILKQIPTAYPCFYLPDSNKSFDNTISQDKNDAGKIRNLNQPPQAATFIPIKSRYLQGQGSIPFQTELLQSNIQVLGYETYANGMNWPGALSTKEYMNNDLLPCFQNDSRSTQTDKWNAIPHVTNSSTNWQTNHQEATTAHWAVEKTYEYYKNIHNRDGVNLNHGRIGYILTNIPENAFCGFSGPVYRTFGTQTNYPNYDTGGIGLITVQSLTGESWATLDVMAHEYTHGITKITSNLTYQGEPGALNESFSDLIGYCVERHTLPNDWNWLMGEDIAGAGRALRNMQNPGSTPLNTNVGQVPQPDTYLGPNWHGTGPLDGDNGGVHWNSGVMNHWFYLLLAGGSKNGYTVNGIPFDRAEAILYDAFAHRIGSQAMYADARTATLDAAISLYGSCSNEHRQVGEAWAAVGIGTGSGCATDCNFNVTAAANPTNTNCNSTVTLSANCTGSGCSGITYIWSGPNMNSTNGQQITVTTPSNPGQHTYLLSSNKTGCNFSNTSVTVTTNCGLPLSDGCYTIKAKHSDKFMQPENGNNGARIRQYSANGQSNQVFELEAVDGDSYKIKPYGTSKAWEVSNAGTEYGSAIQQWDYFGGSNQKWLVSGWGDGSYRLAPKHAPTLVADVEGISTSDGAGLHLWGQHAGDNQRFYINSVGCPNTSCPAPYLTASPSSINSGQSSTLTASNCSGTVNWSNGLGTGNTKSVSPGSTTTYTATCTVNGCTSGNASVTVVVDQPQSGACISLGDQCSGNSSEIRSYTLNLSSGGSKTVTLNYRSHEGNGTGLIRINGGSWQSFSLNQTPGDLSYLTTGIGSYSFNSGNNTVELASGGGFICFRELCTDGGGGGNPDCNFSASTNPSTINTTPNGSITLSASCSGSGCSGVSYSWSGNGASSNSASYSLNAPGSAGTYVYTVALSKSGCNSQNAQVTVYVGSQSNDCINLGDQCSGNSQEIRSYNISLSSGGNRAVTLTYRAHEGNGTGLIRINGGSWQSFSLNQTPGDLSYLTTGIGSYTFNSGNNTVELASGGGFICFRELCVGNSGGRIGTAEATTVENQELMVSPNPNNGQFEASFYVEPGRKAVLSVTDMQGREVWQKALKGEGKQKETVHLPTQAVGSYILLLSKEATTSTGKVEYKKVVVVK